MDTWLTVLNIASSGVLAFLGSLAGSYYASYRASLRAERDHDRETGGR